MKSLILPFLLTITSFCKAQSSDLIFIPTDNSAVLTVTHNVVGLYVGGRILTSFSNPYTYDTPFAQVTRLGVDLRPIKDVSILIGTRMPYGFYHIELEPEAWVKFRLVNTLKQTTDNVDLTLMVGYSGEFMYGMGLCLPLN